MSDYLDPNNEELLKDFFAEAQGQVDQMEENILVIENDPSNKESIDEMFRAAHTLKGGAGTVQMMELQKFTHILEDVLDEIRSGKLTASGDIVDTILSSIDIIKAMLEARQNGEVYSEDISAVKAKLEACLGGEKKAAAPKAAAPKPASPAAAPPAAAAPAAATHLSEYELLELRETAGSDNALYAVTVKFDEANPMNTVGGIQIFAVLKTYGQVLKTEPDFEKLYEDAFYPEVTYYLATGKTGEEICAKLVIPDVVLSSSAADITTAGPAAAPAKPAPAAAPAAAPRPAPAAPPEPETPTTVPTEDAAPEAAAAPAGAPPQPHKDQHKSGSGQQGSLLRVDSRRIDNLLNLVSETVIAKAAFNQISNHFTEIISALVSAETSYSDRLKSLFDSLPAYLESIQKGGAVKDIKRDLFEKYGEIFTLFDGFEGDLKSAVAKFRSTSQNLGRITGELQEGVMRIRMVPIAQIFSRFPRLVRDLSKSLNKKINLVIEGEDTELDKSVIDDLLDPLIHCVRNSIDHGIEDPATRVAAGKSEDGTILLKASNEGNMIVIQVCDDGKGIDVDAIRKKAVERGLIHPSKNLTDIEAFNMIFDAGFSTAKTVTNISGRGVGLDVVRTMIAKVNGTVSVTSERGKGSKFIIKLPLTLAIIQGLLVRVGNEKYAIPISSVIDSHRIKPGEIKILDNYEVFNVREDVVSLMRLNRLFRIPTEENSEYYFVVIVGNGEEKMGLIVDSLIGEEDVVIKPLRDQFTNVPGIAGANITGDGTVSLIIDVPQLLELGLKREIEDRGRLEASIR
ncbi:MAG: chemotaxis protein CheA [Spirochaetales bacterium]|jgi:two-component system chemotaxis sensor kinase CheA|nr:chemotaxis protein CheA [Spirochaetales bacterium]